MKMFWYLIDKETKIKRYILIVILKSPTEKKYLLDVAKANAARILGVQNLELPASLKEEEEKRSSSDKEERLRADLAPQKALAQVRHTHTHLHTCY